MSAHTQAQDLPTMPTIAILPMKRMKETTLSFTSTFSMLATRRLTTEQADLKNPYPYMAVYSRVTQYLRHILQHVLVT